MCLESDAVYVCNPNKTLDNSTMFVLGYLMAMGQEIFFENEIDESERLLSCILNKNRNPLKELVMSPLEIVRTLAFPYLFKTFGNINQVVDRNTEFNIPVNNFFDNVPKTVCFLGSLTKQLDAIKKQAQYFESIGYNILVPKISDIKTNINGFVIFTEDESDNPIIIESDFLEKCMMSEKIIVCDVNGYIGNTVMLFLSGKNKHLEFICLPQNEWLLDTINYLKKETLNLLRRK